MASCVRRTTSLSDASTPHFSRLTRSFIGNPHVPAQRKCPLIAQRKCPILAFTQWLLHASSTFAFFWPTYSVRAREGVFVRVLWAVRRAAHAARRALCIRAGSGSNTQSSPPLA